MKRMKMPAVTLAVALAAVGFGGCGQDEVEEFREQIQGTWVATGPVQGPNGTSAYMRRTVTFTPTREDLKLEAFFDAALTQRVFTYDSSGPYELLGPSSAVPGGFEANLTNDRSVLTVHVNNPSLMAALGFDDCNLQVDVPQDVSNGCAAPTIRVANCVDMDVFFLTPEGRFQWGDDRFDHCQVRPTALNPIAFERSR